MELFFLSQVDQIVVIDSLDGLVGWNNNHVQAVDLAKFKRLGVRGTGHAGELVVKTEIILESGGCQGLTLCLNANTFLGFNRLVQTFTPATARHGTTCVLVNDHHLIALDNVIHVLLEQMMSSEGRVDVMQQAKVGCGVQALTFLQQAPFQQQLFHFFMAGFGQFHLTGFLIDGEIATGLTLFTDFTRLKAWHKLVDRQVKF